LLAALLKSIVSRSSSPPTPEGGGRAPLVQDGYDLRGNSSSSFHDLTAPPKIPQNYTKTQGKRLFEEIDFAQKIASAPCPHLYPSNVVQMLNRWYQLARMA
jgi:hypothetical protein